MKILNLKLKMLMKIIAGEGILGKIVLHEFYISHKKTLRIEVYLRKHLIEIWYRFVDLRCEI